MQNYCLYIPSKKDPNETKTEAMERIEKNKKKILEDYIKSIDLKMSQDGN